MLQFYFMSIMLNLVAGLVLVFGEREDLGDFIDPKLSSLGKDETFRLVLGILSAVTGFFKLLSVIRGDIPVIGDLLPALSGLAGGFILLYEYYRTRTSINESTIPGALKTILSSRRYVGILCLAAAALHFLFPTVLFL